MLANYQDIISSVARIKAKDLDNKKFINLVTKIKEANIKYGVLDYDNWWIW